jgi:RNA recognition motif-containing protein
MDPNSHLTLLNLLSKEDLVNVSSALLTENVAMKSRLEHLESQASIVINAFKNFQLEPVPQPIEKEKPVDLYEQDLLTRKIFVRNISFRANKYDLYNIFSRYGAVEHAKILYETTSSGYEQSRGFGFVVFENAIGAQHALKDKYITIDGRVAECHLAVNGKDVRPTNKQNKH